MAKLSLKKKSCIAVAAALVIVGGSAVYARTVPGWDEPWDPPNYYSPTSISWADTNNPSFFYRDLGWQGGSVLDPKRLAQWVTTVSQCVSWLSNAENILELKIINSLPISADIFNKDQQMLKKTQTITAEAYKRSQGQGIFGSEDFRKSNRWNEDEYEYSADKQAQAVENATAKIAETSAAAIADTEEINRQLDALLQQAAEAKGERELAQINMQIQALKEAVWARRNALITNFANMNSITETVKNNKLLNDSRQIREAKLNIQD
uniref:hypothetical protein n=1 Tax=Anaerovibrio slackiae TaxID=2652309 RepID=UPI003868765A